MSKDQKKNPTVDPLQGKDEVEILFPEEQVGPYTLKPWTLEEFMRVYPVIKAWALAALEKGFSLEKFGDLFLRPLDFADTFLPVLPNLVAAYLGKEAEDLQTENGNLVLALGVNILRLNFGQLKNWLNLAALLAVR